MSAKVPAPMIGVSPTRPGNLPVIPPVEVAAARSPRQSRATAPTVPCRRASSSSAIAGSARRAKRLLQAPRHRASVAKYSGSAKIKPACSRQKASAPSPTSRTCGECSITARAARTGFFGPKIAGDRAGPAVAPVHHRGVHLLRAGGGEHRAASGIEQRVVLQRDDRCRHRVERAAAGGKDRAAGLQRAAQPGMVFGLRPALIASRRHRAGAAMHGKRIGRHSSTLNHPFGFCRLRDRLPYKRADQRTGAQRHDPGATALPRPPRSPPLLRLVPLGLGISVVPLDTAVNIAFPDITGSFGLPIPMIQWVVICYVLTHAGLMLAFGRVGDMWGHARVFRAGLVVEHRGVSAVRGGAELRLRCCSSAFCRGSGPG